MTAEKDNIMAFVDLLDALSRGEYPSIDDFMAALDEADRRVFQAILNARSELKVSTKRVVLSFGRTLSQTEALFESSPLPEVLEELEMQRIHAGDDRDELIRRIADAAHVPNSLCDKFMDYYQELSTGLIDPCGITPRLLNAIAQVMGTTE